MKHILIKALSFSVGMIGLLSVAWAQSLTKQDTDIFPKPAKGFKKMIIDVPHSSNDHHKRIEFYVGKWMEVDGCNHFGLEGTLETMELQGWGYEYYVFKTKGDVVATEMACPEAPKRNLFVAAPPHMVRYNGRLPIVVYVPDGYEIQFKIFKAEEDTYIAAEDPAGH